MRIFPKNYLQDLKTQCIALGKGQLFCNTLEDCSCRKLFQSILAYYTLILVCLYLLTVPYEQEKRKKLGREKEEKSTRGRETWIHETGRFWSKKSKPDIKSGEQIHLIMQERLWPCVHMCKWMYHSMYFLIWKSMEKGRLSCCLTICRRNELARCGFY